MNYAGIKYDVERSINNTFELDALNNLKVLIGDSIRGLEESKIMIPLREKFINDHITKKYKIELWKHKGEYQDTNIDYTTSYKNQKKGVYYCVSFYIYYYIDGKKIEPAPNGAGYSYTYSRSFSPLNKKLAYQYIDHLCKMFNITVFDARLDPDCVNDTCILVSERV